MLKYPLTIILLAILFLIMSCTSENSINDNSYQTLSKITGVEETNPFDKYFERAIESALDILAGKNEEAIGKCMIMWVFGATFFPDDDEHHDDNHNDKIISKHYDFRDNYLAKSDKGIEYIACYYILSEYGIENNLVNQYYKEHYELLKNSIGIAYDLQYSNNNQILIKKETADNLKDILKVYRNSSNHREIEPILNYLEADLEKYYKKPKYEISMDFESN
jgi:hypothetical protein